MKAIIETPQALLMDVSVDLSRRNVRVSEHGLNRAQIRTVLEQMRGEAVPKKMRMEVSDTDRCAMGLEVFPETLAAEPTTVSVDENDLVPTIDEVRAYLSQVALDPLFRRLSQRNHPLTPPLPQDHQKTEIQ